MAIIGAIFLSQHEICNSLSLEFVEGTTLPLVFPSDETATLAALSQRRKGCQRTPGSAHIIKDFFPA